MGPGRQFRIERLSSLEQQIDAELGRLTRISEQVIVQGQGQAARMGAQQAVGLIEAAAPELSASFSRLPTAAVESLVGQTGAGTPLRELLGRNGQIASQNARDLLSRAVVSGMNPRDISRELGRILGRSQWEGERIARTEMLRAHREANLETYRQNQDIISGYKRICAHSSRTCAVCLALDQTLYKLDRMMPTHPNCRCTLIPVLRDELGNAPIGRPGAQWFDAQDEKTQRAILGPAKHELYAAGRITLDDLVGIRQDKTWGPTTYEKPLGKLQLRTPTIGVVPRNVTPIRRSPPDRDDGLVNVGMVGL